jgi:predicted metal-dependent hydrolase
VRERASELGVAVRRISVRDQRTRWGSASCSGSLSFSWRLVMAPGWVLDYVVVHELAHLRHAGHGLRFWGLVRRTAPRTDEARGWLLAHEDELRHALD